eukprot:6248866-Amphidinium_carterae.2
MLKYYYQATESTIELMATCIAMSPAAAHTFVTRTHSLLTSLGCPSIPLHDSILRRCRSMHVQGWNCNPGSVLDTPSKVSNLAHTAIPEKGDKCNGDQECYNIIMTQHQQKHPPPINSSKTIFA